MSLRGRAIEKHMERIEKIAGEMDCPNDFKCYKPGVLKPCGAALAGGGLLVECLEKDGRNCKFALPFGYSIICKCPVQCYLIKNCKDILDSDTFS